MASKFAGAFDDLVPAPSSIVSAFDDLIPVAEAPKPLPVGEGLMMRARSGIGQAVGGAQQMLGEQFERYVGPSRNLLGDVINVTQGIDPTIPDNENPALRQAREGVAGFADQGAAVAEQARFESEEAQQGITAPESFADAFGNPGNTLRYYGGLMAESAPMMAAAMATRNPAVATAATGVGTAGQTYGTERAKGASPQEAFDRAGVSGFMESGLGLVPFEKALGAGSLGRRMVKAGLSETGTEGVTGVGQLVATDAMKGKDTSRADINRVGIDSAIVGGGIGAGMAVLGSGRPDQKAKTASEQTQDAIQQARGRQDFRDFERELNDSLTPTARPAPRTPAEAGSQAAEDALANARARTAEPPPAPGKPLNPLLDADAIRAQQGQPPLPETLTRRGRDEKYGVDVEMTPDGKGGYLHVETDASGRREKKIEGTGSGIYQGKWVLNEEGEFVSANTINRSANEKDTAKRPFQPPTKEQRQAVVDLVAEIAFERSRGNMARAESLESTLADIAMGRVAATPAPAAAPLDAPLGDIPAESTTDLDAAIDAMLAPTTETAPDGRLGTSAPIAAPPVVGSNGLVDATAAAPDPAAGAVGDVAPETGRRPFLTPDDVAREKFTARATEAGLSPEQIAQMTPDTLADDVTGFFDGRLKGVKSGTILRAQEHVEATGEPAFYVDGDIVNLGGLNKAAGENMEAANAHYRAMTDILRAELESTGGDIVPLRTGGDEVGAVVVNAPEPAIRAAMTAANAKVRAYAQANGFGDIPHTKADRTDRGVGLHLGLAPIQPGASLSDIIEASSAEIAASKGGTPDVNGSQTERLGPVAPVGPAGSVGGSVAAEAQGAGGQDAARLGEAPSAQGDAQGVRAAPQVTPADQFGPGFDPLPNAEADFAPVGSWVDGPGPDSNSPTGRILYQVRDVPIADLDMPELVDGDIAPEKRKFMPEYERRAASGEQPPNIVVTERYDGTLKVSDGTRRTIAAMRAGKDTIRALVSPSFSESRPAPPPSARPAPKGRSTLRAIAKTIGLDLADFKRQGVDPANFRGSKGSMPGLFRKQGGMTLSRFREWAQENEYLPRDPENAPPTVSDDDALDLFYRLFANEEAVALGDADANVQAKAEQERKRAEDRLNADPAAAMQRQRARDIGNERALEALADFDNGLLTAPGLQKRLDDAETYDESAVPFSRTDKPKGIALNILSRVVRSLFSGWTNAPTVRAVQSVADVPADVRERARLSQSSPFYSALVRSVASAQGAPKRADAAAWKGWLDGAQRRGEFKQSERDWLGVDAWLDGRGATTREELAEFVRANQVQVQDVVLGENPSAVLSAHGYYMKGSGPNALLIDSDTDVEANMAAAPVEVLTAFAAMAEGRDGGGTKFASYRAPGGENYRELLLTLPQNLTLPDGFEVRELSDGRWGVFGPGPLPENRYGSGATREAAIRSFAGHGHTGDFRSNHWDQPNVLAHVRFDERTDSDGKRVLFVQEIQSDWHQAGRKHGYKTGDEAGNFATFMGRRGRAADTNRIFAAQNDLTGDDAALWREWRTEADRYAAGIPNAPLKATDEWAMLAFKRMVRWASENGFDRIAWTTGEQAADLFDLSKQVDRVLYKKNPDGTFRVSAITGNRGNPMGDSIAAEKLEDFVGKDVAQRMIEGQGVEENLGGSGTTSQPKNVWMALSGDGLKVGGAGMRGFYDKILPAAVGKWGKKFGAKVGAARLMNASAFDKFNGYEDGRLVHTFDTRFSAAMWANNGKGRTFKAADAGGDQVHAIDITPAMREAALDGLPLFSRESEGTPEGFFDPQTETVWLIADALSTPSRARWVAYHEVTGHYGIRGVVDRIGKGAGSLRKAFSGMRSNPTIDKLARAIAFDRGMSDAELDVATEEAAAELSAAEETGDWQHLADRYNVTVPASMRPGIRGAIDRFVQSIKRLFSIIAEGRTDAFTDADWRELVAGARRYVREGTTEESSSVDAPLRSAKPKLEPARVGDVFLFDPTRVATVMGALPGGRLNLRIEGTRNGKPSLSIAEYRTAEVKEWSRLGRAEYSDGAYLSAKSLLPDHAALKSTAPDQTQTAAFARWFGDSKVVDAQGRPLVVYHGTTADIQEFDVDTVVAGFHFGSAPQANMRIAGRPGRNVMPVYLAIENPRRSKDAGGKWASKIKAARSAGHDGIVYLNRYEGIPLDAFQRAAERIAKERGGNPDFVRLDGLTDDQFRKYVPEAKDSYIAFRPEQIKSAIGNSGAFGPNNPSILKSVAPRSVAEMKAQRAALSGTIRNLRSEANRAATSAEQLRELSAKANAMIGEVGADQRAYDDEIKAAKSSLAERKRAVRKGETSALADVERATRDLVAAETDAREYAAKAAAANRTLDRVERLESQATAEQRQSLSEQLARDMERLADSRDQLGVNIGRVTRILDARKEAEEKRNTAAGELGVSRGAVGWNYDRSAWVGRKGALKRARAVLQDKMQAWAGVQEQIAQQVGAAIPDAQNVYRMETLMHGRVSEQMDALERGSIEPIMRAIADAGVTVADVEQFMYARHAQERNADIAAKNPAMPDGGSGMTNAEAAAILAGADAKTLAPLADRVKTMIQQTRVRLYKHGLISREQFDALNAQYQHYVPLRGKPDQEFEQGGGGNAGRGIDSRRTPVQEALGRGAGNRAQSILGEVVADAQRAIILAEKARVGRTVMRLVLANPNPSLWTVEPVQTERRQDANGEVYEAVVNDWSDPSIVAVKVSGKLYKVQFTHAPLAQALNMVGVDQLGQISRAAGALNRYFSAVLTRYNPAFVPVNAARDALFGLTGLAVEHGEAAALDAALHYPQAARAAFRSARGKSGNSPWDAWAKEFAEAGGKTGYVAMPSVEDLQRAITGKGLSKYSPNGIAKLGHAVADAIGAANDAVENALRLSAYVTLRKRGQSAEAAAEYAKNLTVNFNRKGYEGSRLNAWFLFYNAAMQGAKRAVDVMRKPKTWAYLGGLAAAQTIAAMAAMGMEDEDGEPLWNKVPDHVKRRNLVIVTPEGGVVTIPMPYGFNVFTYLAGRIPTAMMDPDETKASNRTGTIVGDTLSALVESFVPVPVGEGALGLLPTALRIPVNVAVNKDDFGRSIRTENPYGKHDVPRASMGKPDTPEVFKLAAQGLNRIGGGDEYTPPPMSWFDRAPEDFEYLLGELTGGAGKFVMDVATLGGKLATDAPVMGKDVPIAKRFAHAIDEQAAQQSMFYERRDTISRSLEKVKDTFKRDGEEAATAMMDAMPELKGASFRRRKNDSKNGPAGSVEVRDGRPVIEATDPNGLYALYKATEDAVAARNEAIREAYADAPAGLVLPNAERDRKVREQNTARMEAQRRFNARWVVDVVGVAE